MTAEPTPQVEKTVRIIETTVSTVTLEERQIEDALRAHFGLLLGEVKWDISSQGHLRGATIQQLSDREVPAAPSENTKHPSKPPLFEDIRELSAFLERLCPGGVAIPVRIRRMRGKMFPPQEEFAWVSESGCIESTPSDKCDEVIRRCNAIRLKLSLPLLTPDLL